MSHTTRQRLSLAPGDAHVWLVFPETITDSTLLDMYYALLTSEEQEQLHRFRFAQHQRDYLITRALLRTTLSRYAPVPPHAWRFVKNPYGKPALAAPFLRSPLFFNLSHTTGLIACLIALRQEVGIDVEDTTRPGDTVEVAEQFFSPAEVAALRAAPPEAQRDHFFQYWTLKESYIKARGLGLSLPLAQFSFHLQTNGPPQIAFAPCLQEHPQHWQFVQSRPTQRHALAVAIHRGDGPNLDIHFKQTVPLP